MFGDWKIAALCTSRVYDLQVHGFIAALNEKLQNKGFALWVYALNEDLYWEEDKYPAEASVFGYIPYDQVDVVIVMDEKIKSHSIVNGIISVAKEQEKPVVILDGNYEGCSSVKFDFAAGFEVENNVVLEFAGIRIPLFFFDKEVVRLGENSSDANFFILFLKADCPALDTGRRRYYTVG